MRAGGSRELALRISAAEAAHWAYVVRNRRRWADHEQRSAEQANQARKLLSPAEQAWFSGLESSRFDGLVEVHLAGPAKRDQERSATARIFPWEYVLTAVARDRTARPLTVVRSLALERSPRRQQQTRALLVESAPGGLRREYTFEAERELVRNGLGLAPGQVRIVRSREAADFAVDPANALIVLQDPSPADLEAVVVRFQPAIVHLTGFDSHQGGDLLRELAQEASRSQDRRSPGAGAAGAGEKENGEERRDGYLLQLDGRPHAVQAEELARILCAARLKPRLVCFNLYNSAARLASQAVAAGAQAAIGFLDEFDDSLTERFFAELYAGWHHSGCDPLAAFRWAFDSQRKVRGSLRGTSVVYWSGAAVFDAQGNCREALPERERDFRQKVREARSTTLQVSEDLAGKLRFEIEPLRAINYSLLHNNQGLFEKFNVHKHAEGTLRGVDLEVLLHMGADSAPFRLTLDLVEPVTPIAPRVRVPLTSALARAVRESVRTSLYVHATAGGRTLYRDTFPVQLLSATEWRDTDEDRIWLPSFVLPRDPAVARIVDSAQRYLMAIQDDPGAGFDGYQSYDPQAEDPSALIDQQVRALWSALIYDHPLAYINPPPTYTESSQRIRTPSEIVGGRRGTCIDLTLLVAACLEHVEIYPALFLLRGHAFPGYWRSEEDYESFLLMERSAPREDGEQAGQGGNVQRYGWYFGPSYYSEILRFVREGSLVPLESVWLTNHNGFAASQEVGYGNLRSKREFDAMLDVLQARSEGVTPLPIREEGA